MTLNNWSASLAGLAPALGNHLWQSTIFLVAAGLLTLSLRKNPARVRYWLWLAASVKFLIPFSLLITVGSHLWRGSARTNPGFYHAIDAVGQPFPLPLVPQTSGAYPSTVLPRATPLIPILFAVWLSGFLVILSVWFARWRQVSATVRKAVQLREGREVEVLRRMMAVGGVRKRIPILLSRASLEPGIFGIARPVLLWPEGLSERLDDAHLEAILAHELWHVQRRDNLAAAVHMLVEAAFWFHPLVWWLGARMVEERERACDEQVLEMGGERKVYAETILKICEFCVESPLVCVSGVTGSDLKKRMVYIMTKSVSLKLDFGRKLLLSVAGLLAIVAPIAFGLVTPTKNWVGSQALGTAPAAPMFESAMIRPNNGKSFESWIMWKAGRFMVTNFTLQKLIQSAYGVQSDRVSGGPAWLNSQGYDIDAKPDEAAIDELHALGRNQGLTERRMLQALLADRFKLGLHREAREVSVYALTIAKNGPRLQEAVPGDTYFNGLKDLGGRPIGAGIWETAACKIAGQGVPIADLAGVLSGPLGRTVIDETGLNGNYDFAVDCFAPLRTPESEPSLLKAVPEHAEALTKVHAIETASILEAVSEQLGLELNVQTVPVEVLVIDHAEKPAESQAQDTLPAVPSFESAMIRPNNGEPMAGFTIVGKPFKAITWKGDRLMATNFTLHGLLRVAYGVPDDQILGGPDWLTTEGYDLDAKMEKSVADEMRKRGPRYGVSGRTLMFQKLLSDRFKLSFHRETKDIPVYVLVVAVNGPKLHPAKPDDTYANGLKKSDGSPLGANILSAEEGKLIGQGIPVAKLVEDLSAEYYLHRTVLDKTGLPGRYDFTLQWTPEQNQSAILAAMQQQLGLRVEPQTAPVEVLVIDHAEKPAEN